MFDGSFDEYFARMDANHKKREDEFYQLALDPCTLPFEVGDRIVVAGGSIGRGFAWSRLEATVIEKGQISVKVRFDKPGLGGAVDEEWIHPALITDVLGKTDG